MPTWNRKKVEVSYFAVAQQRRPGQYKNPYQKEIGYLALFWYLFLQLAKLR
uniref:Uncharacterized protein n=1 Tax=Candidatus Kentrum sp. LFY TaxID=2126342 RepID=A0A450ULW2_9GAMM|nr:MAG: hypothetical protein BECKLFY1418B_GA0070995_10475 [Candidatus Kentron sp. LFY]